MKKKNKVIALFSLAVIIPLLFTNCSTISYKEIYPILQDGKYDSEFPYKGASDELKDISQCVHRINSTVFYKTYRFDTAKEVTLEKIKDYGISQLASTEGYSDQSCGGTALTIYFSDGRVALLTCAHIVSYPDTVISYTRDESGKSTNYLESILIKEKQTVYAAGFPEGSELEVLAIDKKNDLAVIGRYYSQLINKIFPVFNYPLGNAKDLDWGSFVYSFGYPMNNQMVTKAIVSSPNKDGEGSFLVDAVINKGFSGGIVLAIRDGVPNFELVGIIQWVPGEDENVLVPEKLESNESYNSIIPYKGEEYVKRILSIRYGIASVISIETVKEFITSNKDNLYSKKYYLDKFIEE
jgi:hypothetical protein